MEILKSGIYGFIVGDALGVPYEFMERGSFYATTMMGYGTHNQPEGTWSDDTSMMLATLDSIKECGRIDCKDMMQKYCNWYFDSAYTANGDVFDVGNTCLDAMLRFRKDENIETCGGTDDYDNGNGALMRILPLAFYSATEEEIDKVTGLTHNHGISKEASRIYIALIRSLSLNEDIETLLATKPLSEKFKHLRKVREMNENEIRSGGYVVDTLTAAIWCFLNTYSYRECVLKAVNLGSDTDTTAAVVGALAGLKYGYKSIPKEWIESINNKELVDNILSS